jgi:PAS domain S-box-containing protein
MGTNSTNKLLLAALQLAYHLGVGTPIAGSYTSVQQVEQVNSTQKRHRSRYFWLLRGSFAIGSVVWLVKLSDLQSCTIPIAGLVTTVVISLLAVTLVRIKQLTNSTKLAQEAQTEQSNPKVSSLLRLLKKIASRLATPPFPKTVVLDELAGQTQNNYEQAPNAIIESKAPDQLLAQNATNLISRYTREGIYSYASPACCLLLGYEPEELVGRCAYEFFHPQDVPALNQPPLEILYPSEINPISYRIRRQDGNYIWFESTTTAIQYPQTSAVQEIVTVSRNITEQKQTEAELLEGMRLEQALLTRLFALAAEVGVALAKGGKLLEILQRCTQAMVQQLDTTSAAIWTLNPVSQQLEQQAAAGEVIVLNPDLLNIVAQNHQPYFTSEGLEVQKSSLLPHYFSSYSLVVEDRLLGVITLLGNQPLTEEACRTLSWIANAIAVAIDRYWARSELLGRRESLLSGLANQIRNSLELDTILETAVQSIHSLLQIDRCHFLWYRAHETTPYWEVVNEARNPILPSHIGRYTTAQLGLFGERLLNQQIIKVDEVETYSDTTLRQLLLTLGYTSLLSIPVETKLGEIGVIICGHCTGSRPWDNSEVELLQAVVVELAIGLDQAKLYAQARQAAHVAQAQAQQLELALSQLQATQAQLVQSEKMSSLGQLVAGIAHEINNPINFIHGNLTYASAYFYDLLSFLRLYQKHYPNPDAEILEQAEVINVDFIATDLPKLLGSMQRGTDRIRSIVLSLRNFSRLDEADIKQVDLHEGIENTLLILQHRLKAKGQNPEIQVFKEYGNLPTVECYPGQLNQVFMNILTNAIEAFERSRGGTQECPSPSITIRTTLLESSDSTQNAQNVLIQIADNGPGMTESVKARIFDPFFSTKPVGEGTGLGLAISYQVVVKHHHGILTCTSAPGRGTEFLIEIPILQNN